ncbi:hypothetical protein D3C73_888140 [compost metagenome]
MPAEKFHAFLAVHRVRMTDTDRVNTLFGGKANDFEPPVFYFALQVLNILRGVIIQVEMRTRRPQFNIFESEPGGRIQKIIQ